MYAALSFFIVLIFFSEFSEARKSCIVPTTPQLKQFFNNKSLWTEVLSVDSKIIASRKVIRLDINFLEPSKSKILKGSKSMGDSFNFCTNEKVSALFIATLATDITLVKTEHGSLESKISILGFEFNYYYLPDGQVLKNSRNIAQDPNEWNMN